MFITPVHLTNSLYNKKKPKNFSSRSMYVFAHHWPHIKFKTTTFYLSTSPLLQLFDLWCVTFTLIMNKNNVQETETNNAKLL